MSEPRPRPTRAQIIIWTIPVLAGLIFTILALIIHNGVEWGLGGLLFGILYFIIRYSMQTIETPDQ
jgi:hypothetical protein